MAASVLFRADASLEIGSGHVMRCLTLASALRGQGAECHFACRNLPGDMSARIMAQGFPISLLADEATPAAFEARRWDWLVVDHYGLDATWESTMRPSARRILAIDDLADRAHDADMLLDQSPGRLASHYDPRLPRESRRLIGPDYALLRPQFAAMREASLKRRALPMLSRILVSMGGTDLPNATGRVLSALAGAGFGRDISVTVVMGGQAPALESVRALAATVPFACAVRVDVADMAALMAASDLAIGAGGGTALERCSLGLPAITIVLAENQRPGTEALAAQGAVAAIASVDEIAARLPSLLDALRGGHALAAMARAAASVCDGLGTDRVLAAMEAY